MATSYLDLTNKVLRKINEVELTSSNFASARGLHAAAKEAVSDAVDEINKVRWEWPFNAFEHSQNLATGVNEYAWPAGFKSVDWTSFQIQKDDTLNVSATHLRLANRVDWYDYQRDPDYNSLPTGRRKPAFVFPAHGNGWGVTPVPDQNYAIKFRYFKHPEALETYDDVTTIPEEFDYVILQGALYHMYTFVDNDRRAANSDKKFKDGISFMSTLLVPEDFSATSTMIDNSGNFNTGYYWPGY